MNDDIYTKARLFDDMTAGVLADFPDIIRGEWNTVTPGGGLPGCIEGALRERAALLAENERLREALDRVNEVTEEFRTALRHLVALWE